jgi:site-specific DNA-methyltransferase (adenine-specific)
MSGILVQGDCREVMLDISVQADCIVTDPPYGQTSLKWDVPVKGWLDAAEHVLKPNASVWIFGSLRSLAPIVNSADEGTLGDWRFAQDIVWEKHNGSSFHNDRFRRVHEQAIQLYRGPWKAVYKDVQKTMDARKKTVRRKERPAHMGEIANTTYTSTEGGPRLMRSVLRVRSEHGRAIHPTQKPVGILEPLIAYSCPPGGQVIDPFAGAGSTLSAAEGIGRRWVGIELDHGYVEKASTRIMEDHPQCAMTVL